MEKKVHNPTPEPPYKLISKLVEACLCVPGPMLFNLLPRCTQEVKDCKTGVFENAFNKWLNTIADEPQDPGYIHNRHAAPNSICRKTISALMESRTVPFN